MGKKHKVDKQRKNRIEKRKAKQTIIIVDEHEPKDVVDKLKEQPGVDVKVVSVARRAFQDV